MDGKLRGTPVCEPILIWRGPVSPKPVLLSPSTTRFVSESSHGGGRTRRKQCPAHLRYPVCEQILTKRGSGAPKPTTQAPPPRSL